LGKFSEDMMLMCERFRLVEIFADRALSVPSPLDQEEGSASALAHDGLKV
jgi:hypothetical protein